jgi:hypothetical protein
MSRLSAFVGVDAVLVASKRFGGHQIGHKQTGAAQLLVAKDRPSAIN